MNRLAWVRDQVRHSVARKSMDGCRRSIHEGDPWPENLNGDIANLSIGQGDTLATPLQVAQSMAIVGNGGIFIKPDRPAGANGG